jgi:hypothetical protein
MFIISKSSALANVTLPILKILLRPVLWLRNMVGYLKSNSFSSSKKANNQLSIVNERWRRKIDVVLSSDDNAAIPRVANAGQLKDGLITMHNGILVSALGYYGSGYLNMLVENKGVHEPQEERVFGLIVRLLKPGSTMIELGAYWGFYSLWFSKEVANPSCHLVEPSYANLCSGRENFKRSNYTAAFTQAYVGHEKGIASDGTDVICVDDYCRKHQIKKLEILHADIQGAESLMIDGADAMLKAKKVDYIFISTHSNPLHAECVKKLQSYGYEILASADMNDSYSGDGLIVARSPLLTDPIDVEISYRTKKHNPHRLNHARFDP